MEKMFVGVAVLQFVQANKAGLVDQLGNTCQIIRTKLFATTVIETRQLFLEEAMKVRWLPALVGEAETGKSSLNYVDVQMSGRPQASRRILGLAMTA
jgi:hypothetical protein